MDRVDIVDVDMIVDDKMFDLEGSETLWSHQQKEGIYGQ